LRFAAAIRRSQAAAIAAPSRPTSPPTWCMAQPAAAAAGGHTARTPTLSYEDGQVRCGVALAGRVGQPAVGSCLKIAVSVISKNMGESRMELVIS
jgi:hypothetical protein